MSNDNQSSIEGSKFSRKNLLKILKTSSLMLPLPFIALYFNNVFIIWFSIIFISFIFGWQVFATVYFGGNFINKATNLKTTKKQEFKILGKYDSPFLIYVFSWLLLFILAFALQSWDLFYISIFGCQGWLLGYFAYRWSKYISSKGWKKTNVNDISAECNTTHSNGSSTAHLLVEYRYHYIDMEFSGNRVQYPFFSASNEVKYKIKGDINKNKIGSVFVNPNNPLESVLFNKIARGDIYLSIVYIISSPLIFIVSIFLFLEQYS